MKVLVTGGAGYIGSHACKALARAGYDPITYDNLSTGHRWAVKWGPLIEGDIADRARLDAVLREHRPEAVMHFAASAYVGESVTDPGKYYRNNVVGTLTLLEAMRDQGIKRVVFSSTCATYGVPNYNPIDEKHPQRPINPYGSSKLMVERMLADFGAAHGLRSIALRYFNAAGADPEGEIGEEHQPETHLIPLALQAASTGAVLTVFGSDYDTPDGTCMRDFIHVNDIAAAHVLALRALERGAPSAAYNLGNGHGFSVREVIACVRQLTGKQLSVETTGRRPGDPPKLVGDARLARQDLGWTPAHAMLEDIIGTALRWHERRAEVLAET